MGQNQDKVLGVGTGICITPHQWSVTALGSRVTFPLGGLVTFKISSAECNTFCRQAEH